MTNYDKITEDTFRNTIEAAAEVLNSAADKTDKIIDNWAKKLPACITFLQQRALLIGQETAKSMVLEQTAGKIKGKVLHLFGKMDKTLDSMYQRVKTQSESFKESCRGFIPKAKQIFAAGFKPNIDIMKEMSDMYQAVKTPETGETYFVQLNRTNKKWEYEEAPDPDPDTEELPGYANLHEMNVALVDLLDTYAKQVENQVVTNATIRGMAFGRIQDNISELKKEINHEDLKTPFVRRLIEQSKSTLEFLQAQQKQAPNTYFDFEPEI